MNNIQRAALTHLLEGGEGSHRDAALNQLQDLGLFNYEQTEEGSRTLIEEYIERVREDGAFCDEGIGRFSQAVLGVSLDDLLSEDEPTPDRLFVSFQVDVNALNGDGLDSQDVAADLGKIIALASSPDRWSVEACYPVAARWGR